MNTRQFLVRRLSDLLGKRGRDDLAAIACCGVDTINKAANDRELSVEQAVKLIAGAGKIRRTDIEDVVSDYAAFFVPPRKQLVWSDVIEEAERSILRAQLALQAMREGKRIEIKEATENCPHCDSPVEFIRVCGGCRRGSK